MTEICDEQTKLLAEILQICFGLIFFIAHLIILFINFDIFDDNREIWICLLSICSFDLSLFIFGIIACYVKKANDRIFTYGKIIIYYTLHIWAATFYFDNSDERNSFRIMLLADIIIFFSCSAIIICFIITAMIFSIINYCRKPQTLQQNPNQSNI